MGRLYFGDNLDVLQRYQATETVDLIYLDPPFNSRADYNLVFKSADGTSPSNQLRAFGDVWRYGPDTAAFHYHVGETCPPATSRLLQALHDVLGNSGMLAYLTMMAARLGQLHRVLKSTGSLYLHCDPTASHYLKLILDSIFGASCFRNEIVWRRSASHNSAQRYGKVADIILFYTKTDNYTFNDVRVPYSSAQLARYRADGEGRLYRAENLTADRRNSNSGKFAWRGTLPPSTRGWAHSREQLEEWWEEGRILTRRDGSPRMDGLKVYLDGSAGQRLQSIWSDIPRIANTARERVGYPTQKPLDLLKRIVAVSSNPGEVVLDPFCGGGTTLEAAQELGRQWIGIDITHLAVAATEKRLRARYGATLPIAIVGEPATLPDARHLAETRPDQFEFWIIHRVGGRPHRSGRGADRGIDGYLPYLDRTPAGDDRPMAAIISVKGGRPEPAAVRALSGVMKREDADFGILLSVAEPTTAMHAEATLAGVWADPATGRTLPRIQFLTAKDVLAGHRPNLPHDVSLTAEPCT